MQLKYKKRFYYLVIFLLFIGLNSGIAHADYRGHKILVIGSYSVQNEWENEILSGFAEKLAGKDSIKVEFLDAGSEHAGEENYYNSISNLLNIKYRDEDIDSVFLIDDEALEFARKNIFNKESFLYKKPLFFVGVNRYIDFSEEEKKYISGIMDVDSNVETVNVVLDTQKKLKNLYVIINNSEYCNSMKNEILNMDLEERGVAVNIIMTSYIEDIKKELSSSDMDNSAIVLCGTYKYSENDVTMRSKEVINYIKGFTDSPIYSTLYNYVEAGAIGGIVNDGVKLGGIGAEFLEKITSSDYYGEKYFITISNNRLKTGVFNFKAIREYNINPLDCPPNSIYLYKKRYNLLLPKNIIYTIWASIIILIITIISMIYSTISNKKIARRAKLKAIEAEEREKIKTNYIMIMSHEFRTPLNIIVSISEVLMLKYSNAEEDSIYYKEKLQSIIKNSNRLNKIIDDFIDISKLESGIMELSMKNNNIIEAVEETVESAVAFAEERSISIIFDTDEEEVYMIFDKKQIEKIVLRLLSNSIKNIEDGGHIKISCEKDGEFICIKVEDDGRGIENDKVKHIFEKFYQVNESYLTRSYEGNGVGLFITKKIIELHGGEISVESKEGIGTSVKIKLPINTDDEVLENNNEYDDDIEYLKRIEFSDI
ncbi:MAG: HAMP domain-containing sensor histidine kinase [Clostridium sp.]|nr:HAMP domain-containing sensor histidine kinase [Clostridium sp.]